MAADINQLSSLERDHLDALLRYMDERNIGVFTLGALRSDNPDGVRQPFLEMALDGLVQKGFFGKNVTVENDDEEYGSWTIDSEAASFLYDYVEAGYNAAPDRIEPAAQAGAFIDLASQPEQVTAAVEKLGELSAAVRATNDLWVSADERLAIIAEIDGIAESLRQRVIRASNLLQRFARGSLLRWIGTEASSAVVRELALSAVQMLVVVFRRS